MPKSKHFEQKEVKKLKSTIRIISIILIVLCVIYIIAWIKDNKKNNDIMNKLSNQISNNTNSIIVDNEQIDNYNVDFQSLKAKNSDTVGWLKVNNTQIDYPVVKTNNNEFYLTHDFEKNNNSAGWIFANSSCRGNGTDKNLVIFGHNRKDKSMFGSLSNVLKKDWDENESNKFITYKTENETIVYEVFSIYQIEVEDYYIKTDFKDDNEYINFLNKLKSRSLFNYNTELNLNDRILTLSTCANNNKYRVVLHAKRIL